MTTITLVLAIIANLIAIYTLAWCMSTSTEMLNMEDGLRDCATRTRNNKLKLDTLDNKVNKPKAKRGRPKKNAPKPHQVNGVQ
tara:strand:+ start:40282 stop:40530 length:249 start_codon:yes stop_codon:yes gene_type:complete